LTGSGPHPPRSDLFDEQIAQSRTCHLCRHLAHLDAITGPPSPLKWHDFFFLV